MKALSNQQRIVEFLQQRQQGAISEIADALALTGKQTSAAMQRLAKRSQVERVPGQRKIRYQLVANRDERLRRPRCGLVVSGAILPHDGFRLRKGRRRHRERG